MLSPNEVIDVIAKSGKSLFRQFIALLILILLLCIVIGGLIGHYLT